MSAMNTTITPALFSIRRNDATYGGASSLSLRCRVRKPQLPLYRGEVDRVVNFSGRMIRQLTAQGSIGQIAR